MLRYRPEIVRLATTITVVTWALVLLVTLVALHPAASLARG